MYFIGTLFSEEFCNREMMFCSASESCTLRIGYVLFRTAMKSYPVKT